MGLAVGADAIAVGSRRDIHVLRAAHDVAPGAQPAGTFDAAWLARHSFRTGSIHGHEMAWGRDGLWVVNTLFSSLCTLDQNFSFVPRWRPPFISELSANDRCHLNGLALLDGRPKFVTAHGDSNEPGGWRPTKATGGVVIDVESGETIARGFAMPHSPRLALGRLWVLNSGAGQIGTIDIANGKFEPVETVPGFTRGLAFQGQFACIGLSKIRETSVFGGMPLEKDRASLCCGVAAIDLTTGRVVATLQFHSGVDEIFGVSVLPNTAQKLFRRLQPNVVVVDLTLQDDSGLDLIKWIKKQQLVTKVIVSTMHDERVYGERALRAGANGYVNKRDPARTIIYAINRVLEGKLQFSEDLVNRVMSQAMGGSKPHSASPLDSPSDRELYRHRSEAYEDIGDTAHARADLMKVQSLGTRRHK